MVKRGKDRLKEGQLANFPELEATYSKNRHYLFVALILVFFSAFASFLTQDGITGQASTSMTRWRQEGLTAGWNLQNTQDLHARDSQGRIIVDASFRCPKQAVAPPENLASTKNQNNCFNAARLTNQILPTCAYRQESKGKVSILQIKCVRQ